MPIKFIINLYLNLLSTYQEAESPRTAFLSKLDNTVNKNSIFNTKCAKFSTNARCSLIFTTRLSPVNQSLIFTTCMQPPLKSPLNFSSANYRLPIPPLTVHKIILTIPFNTYVFCTSALFLPPYFCVQQFLMVFSLPLPYTQFRDQSAREPFEDWLRLNFCLLSQSINREIRAHNQWLLITQAQKIGVLQVVVSDENASRQSGKPSNAHFSVAPTYFHYLHTLLIQSRELTFLHKPVA